VVLRSEFSVAGFAWNMPREDFTCCYSSLYMLCFQCRADETAGSSGRWPPGCRSSLENHSQ